MTLAGGWVSGDLDSSKPPVGTQQKRRQLYLTRAGEEAVEDLGGRIEALSMGGGGAAIALLCTPCP